MMAELDADLRFLARSLVIEVGRLADPALRQISATGIPSAPCFSMNACCASLNFEAFIGSAPPSPGDSRCRKLYLKALQFLGLRSVLSPDVR